MKTFTSIIVLGLIGFGIWWWGVRSEVVPVAEEPEQIKLCFYSEDESPDSNFEDKYTLRINLEGEKASGELKLLPAEKDALVGKFEGTAKFTDEFGIGREADLIWNTEGEGMTAKQELKIKFGEGGASVAFGEMVLREDGVYGYKDSTNLNYSQVIPATECDWLNERETVEKYLWGNIATLSPIAPVLGGNWYVVNATIDLENNSGTVIYEDGHIKEKRDFTYVQSASGAVESLTIE